MLIEDCHFADMSAMVGTVLLYRHYSHNSIDFEPSLVVRGSNFENLAAEIAAGAIFIDAQENMTVTIEDSHFENVSAKMDGGVIYAQGLA